MSYYLTDPYHYATKCYPFLDSGKPLLVDRNSTRVTEKNKDIENEMKLRRLKYSMEIDEERKKSEVNLIKIKNKLQDLYSSRKH